MKTIWYSHLTEKKDSEVFRLEVQSARPVLNRLIQILEQDIKNLDEKMEAEDFIKTSRNLKEEMVLIISRKKELKRVISLLNV